MAYKLLRLMRYAELPGKSWQGWFFSHDKLITPEGRSISGTDSSWWSLMVQAAQSSPRMFRELGRARAELAQAKRELDALRAAGPASAASAARATPGLQSAAPKLSEMHVTPHSSPLERKNGYASTFYRRLP